MCDLMAGGYFDFSKIFAFFKKTRTRASCEWCEGAPGVSRCAESFSVPTVVQEGNGKPLYPGGALQNPLGRFTSRPGEEGCVNPIFRSALRWWCPGLSGFYVKWYPRFFFFPQRCLLIAKSVGANSL